MNPVNILKKSPTAVAGAVVAVMNSLIVFGVVTLTGDQVATINTALVMVLSLFVHQANQVERHDEGLRGIELGRQLEATPTRKKGT